MRRLLGALTALFALVGALLVLATLIGLALPRGHRLTRSAVVPGAPGEVWRLVGDLAAYPAWVPRVEKMERLPAAPGRVLWRETNIYGRQTWEEVERVPGRLLVLRLAEERAPYGGTWTYAVAAAPGGGTRVSVTEDAWVSNPFLRFLSRYLVGYGEAVDLYLDGLEDRLKRRTA
jgi:polyketide cyclase/dehydrase/lipid transport protein